MNTQTWAGGTTTGAGGTGTTTATTNTTTGTGGAGTASLTELSVDGILPGAGQRTQRPADDARQCFRYDHRHLDDHRHVFVLDHPMKTRGGFTLIEILLAAVAASLVLGAVYGIFQQAVRIRDSATQRMRDSRVRLRAEKIIRGDLGNALVSGGLLASVLQGDSASPDNASATILPALPMPTRATSPVTCGSRRPPAATTPTPASTATCSRWNITSRAIPTPPTRTAAAS